MRIPSGSTDRKIFFVAVDSVDLKTRKTGLTSFTVYRSRDGGTATVYTTPTVAELSSANMPGVYSLLIDEDTTIGSTHDSEEYCLHITQASMAPVTRVLELFRVKFTEGQSATVANSAVDADVERWAGSVVNALISGRVDANAQVVGDKTGYALTQSFPTNFASMVIDANGRIDLSKVLGVAINALVSGRIDASVGAYQSGLTPLQPTVAGRTLDVTTTGEAGLDLDNTAGTLSSTEIPNLDAAITSRLASGTVASDVTAIKAMTDALSYKKNTAISNFMFSMTDSTNHTPKTGLVNGDFTKKVKIDGGSETDLSGTITEHNSGRYLINLSAGELNGKVISLRFAASGADETQLTIITNG